MLESCSEKQWVGRGTVRWGGVLGTEMAHQGPTTHIYFLVSILVLASMEHGKEVQVSCHLHYLEGFESQLGAQ